MSTPVKTYIKTCESTSAFANELKIYQLNWQHCPSLVSATPPLTLELGFIDAIPYLDVPEGFDASLLGDTIADFHLLTYDGKHSICHNDNQPRNILWDGQKYWLIDFSDIISAPIEHDLSHLFLFWAEELDADSFAAQLRYFIHAYNKHITIRDDVMAVSLNYNIVRFDNRRRRYSKVSPRSNPDRICNRSLLMRMFH